MDNLFTRLPGLVQTLQGGLRRRKWLSILLSAAAVGALGWMVYSSKDQLMSVPWQVSPLPLLAALLSYGAAILVACGIWGLTMNGLGGQAPWGEHIRIYTISRAINRLPGPLLNIAGRLMMYSENVSRKVISLASILELVIAAGAAAALGVAFFPGESLAGLNWLWLLLALGVGLGSIHPSLLQGILRLLRLPPAPGLHYGLTFRWLLVAIMMWLFSGLTLFFIIQTFTVLDPSHLPLVLGAWCINGLVAIVFNLLPLGFGMHELALTLLLSSLFSPAFAVFLAVISRLLLTLFDFLYAGLALVIFSRREPSPSGQS